MLKEDFTDPTPLTGWRARMLRLASIWTFTALAIALAAANGQWLVAGILAFLTVGALLEQLWRKSRGQAVVRPQPSNWGTYRKWSVFARGSAITVGIVLVGGVITALAVHFVARWLGAVCLVITFAVAIVCFVRATLPLARRQ